VHGIRRRGGEEHLLTIRRIEESQQTVCLLGFALTLSGAHGFRLSWEAIQNSGAGLKHGQALGGAGCPSTKATQKSLTFSNVK
jgi:hypothetical protein